ncbi:MAG: sulfate adenylyltransferase subunit CysN [Xanthobacteraceae bacterium]
MADRAQQANGEPKPTADKDLLKVMTCGSVDDGKSTLIGRLLYETKNVFDDQLRSAALETQKFGTTGEAIDFALLVDGLEAEFEQNITIDVGYRYFTTATRSFIVADTPGHEQFTRNMATGASNSELAIILVDARKGVVTQTRRHATICSLFGIRDVVLAVNKIDLVAFEQPAFERIADEFRSFAATLGFCTVVPIPLSARYGDNVTAASPAMPWYRGPTLMHCLESIEIASPAADKPFRFPVQWVNRPNSDFRGICGTVASGRVRPGDPVVIAGSGVSSRVARIVTADGDLQEAEAGDAVTLTLGDEVDVARGDLLVPPTERPSVADQFAAHILWMDTEPLLPGRTYWLRIGTTWLRATVSAIKYKLDVERLEHLAARQLEMNDIGFCNLSTSLPVAFDAFADNPDTGAFILVDRYSNRTASAGTIAFALHRATNIHRERLAVDKHARARAKHQRPCILWFTGLPASGKSSIARLVETQLHASGCHTYMLDGDNIRHGLTRDLGFTDADRVENIRRIGEVAKLFIDAGLIVLCAFISPFRAERQMVRELVGEGEFVEIFVDTPLAECERRDPKGLYAKARGGTIHNFTGVDSPYEPPETPELVLQTVKESAGQLADRVVEHLRRGGYIG